jgi:hypothetical protein
MAKMSGAGEGVDGGAERCWRRRQRYGLCRCWVWQCAARIEVGASASQASERWATSGGHAFALGLRAMLGPGQAGFEDSTAIHDSRFTHRARPTFPHSGTKDQLGQTRTQTSRARASGRGRSDC